MHNPLYLYISVRFSKSDSSFSISTPGSLLSTADFLYLSVYQGARLPIAYSTFSICTSVHSSFNNILYFLYLYIRSLAFQQQILLSLFVNQSTRLSKANFTFFIYKSGSSPFNSRFYILYLCTRVLVFQQHILLPLSVHQGNRLSTAGSTFFIYTPG